MIFNPIKRAIFGRPLTERVELDRYSAPELSQVKSMITAHEAAALSCFAERAWTNGAHRDGLIVDAGCFVGASTVALAQGLQRSDLPEAERMGRIWSYDLFRATPAMAEHYFADVGIGAGEDFQRVFDQNTQAFSGYIKKHAGDIMQVKMPDRPVAILFADILWSFETTIAFGRTFYPRLAVDRSVLIHQDFVYPYTPWIVLSMGLLAESFSFYRNVPYSSVVFNVERTVKAGQIEDPRNISTARAEAIFDDFITKLDGWGKGALAISKALFLGSRGEIAKARSLIDEVHVKFADVPLVMQYMPTVVGHLEKAERDGTPFSAEQIVGA